MKSALSYIVQKRYSQEYENIATDVLAFILQSYEPARAGLMKLLRGIIFDLPDLHFKTQMNEENMRPDMWGMHDNETYVFIENKFWAGLTDNQPVEYLTKLAGYNKPTILLIVGPEKRSSTLWRELSQRLKESEFEEVDKIESAGIVHAIKTDAGPVLALTSWNKLLSTLEREIADDRKAMSDLFQLQSLCDAADYEAFVPFTKYDLTDQRIPKFMVQLGDIMQASIDLAVNEGIIIIKGLKPQSDWNGFGRYARFSNSKGVGIWFRTFFPTWMDEGCTPLWLIFIEGEFGRSHEVRPLLEPWAIRQDIFTVWVAGELHMAIDIETGEEKDVVVRAIVNRLKEVADILSVLK